MGCLGLLSKLICSQMICCCTLQRVCRPEIWEARQQLYNNGLNGFLLHVSGNFRKFPTMFRKTVNSPSTAVPSGSSVWIHSCFAHLGFWLETGIGAAKSNIPS